MKKSSKGEKTAELRNEADTPAKNTRSSRLRSAMSSNVNPPPSADIATHAALALPLSQEPSVSTFAVPASSDSAGPSVSTAAGPAASTGAIRKRQKAKKNKPRSPASTAAVQSPQKLLDQSQEGQRYFVADLKRAIPPPPPRINRESSTRSLRDDIEIVVFELEGEENLEGVSEDPLFPCDYSSLMMPEQSEEERKEGVLPKDEFEWIADRDVRKDASLFPKLPKQPLPASSTRREELRRKLREKIKFLRQGALGDCWLAVAIFLLGYFHGDLLHWLLAQQESAIFFSILLRLNNSWVRVRLRKLFPSWTSGSLAFMQALEDRYLCASTIELGLAKAYGCFKYLTGGLVSIGIAHLTESYAVLYDPSRYTLLAMCELIYSALRAGRMVALNTRRWIQGEPEEHPDMPMLPFGHAFAVVKVYQATFKGQPVILFLCRDPHGVCREGPLCPSGHLFEHLDDQTQADIIADHSGPGFIVLPAEVIRIRFNLIEDIALLPPCPANLSSTPMTRQWMGMTTTMALWHGNWETRPPSSFPLVTPPRRARVVCQLTNTSGDLARTSSAASILEVREEATRRFIVTSSAMYLNQISVTFWSDGKVNYMVFPTSLLRSGTFELLIVILEGAPEDERIPPEFTCEAGELAASLEHTLNMPQPVVPSEAHTDDLAFHRFYSENFFAPEDRVKDEHKEKED